MKRLLALFAAVLVVSLMSPASAHDHNEYFDSVPTEPGLELWPGSSPTVTWHFTEEVGAGKRDAIEAAFDTWEAAGDIDFHKGVEREDSNPLNDEPCETMPDNEIHVQSGVPDGDRWAAQFCLNNQGNIGGFYIVIDSDDTWYAETEDDLEEPMPAQFDLWSAMNKAIAYASGWHPRFATTTSMCDGTLAEHTQCHLPVQIGARNLRSLENHDVHTYQGAYPA